MTQQEEKVDETKPFSFYRAHRGHIGGVPLRHGAGRGLGGAGQYGLFPRRLGLGH